MSPATSIHAVSREKEFTILELLDRILTKGVYISGEVTLSVADVDLVYLSLKVMLSSIEKANEMRALTYERTLAEANYEQR
jgi:gas vesicle structural protein